VPFAGRVLTPVSARVVSVTWPVLDGYGVYVRTHNGSAASYVDITDYVDWEQGDTRFEVSTAAQWLAPLANATLQDLWSPWQPYDVEWRATVTNPTVGNSTLSASFRRLGTSCEVRITLTIGTTATGGSGAWAFTMPPNVAAKSVTNGYALGKTMYVDTSVPEVHEGGCYVTAGDTTIYLTDGGSPMTNVTANAGGVPFAWAAGDTINVSLTLEVDP
jgi:hypothetical protein